MVPDADQDVVNWGLIPPIPSDRLEAIGRISAAWTFIELTLAYLIAKLTSHPDKVGKALTAELTFLQKVALIGSLIDCSQKQDVAELWELAVNDLNQIRNMRNDVIHGFSYDHTEGPVAIRFKAKGKLSISGYPASVTALNQLFQQEVQMLQVLHRADQLFDMVGLPAIIANPPKGSPDRTPSRKARALDQARDAKKLRKQAHRERSQRGNQQRKNES